VLIFAQHSFTQPSLHRGPKYCYVHVKNVFL
jgi:hypothetical protein